MLIWLSLNLHKNNLYDMIREILFQTWTPNLISQNKDKIDLVSWTICSESYHVMIGIGEPKEEQWSSAGLLVITWYTRLGGVSTLGGSAVWQSHIQSKLDIAISYVQIIPWTLNICPPNHFNSPRTLTKAFAIT